MAITWKVYVDWDRDGITTGDDITADVRYARWDLGFADIFERVAGQSTLELELKNADSKYSPENSSGTYFGKFEPHKRVRVDSISDLGTITHWHGWLQSIQPDSNTESPYAFLTATDAKPYLENASTEYKLYQTTTADEVIRDIITQLREWAPAMEPTFVLDQSVLDTDTLADETQGFNLDVGNSTFQYVGDTWDESVTPMQAISKVVKGEGGYFFYNRAGSATFLARDGFTAFGRTPAGTLTYNDYTDINYSYGESILNDIRMNIQPRTFTLDETLIYSLPSNGQFQLNANTSRAVRCRYTLQDSEDDIASIPEDCRAEVTWTPNSGLVSYTVEFFAKYAIVTVTNDAFTLSTSVDVIDIKIYGPNISRKNKLEIKAEDNNSIRKYGRRTRVIDADFFQDEAEAERIVNKDLQIFSNPRGIVNTMYLITDKDETETTKLQQRLQWTIGTRFIINDAPTSHNQAYFIIGEQHTLSNGLKQHNVAYNLRLAADEDYFTLDISSLDGDDVLFD